MPPSAPMAPGAPAPPSAPAAPGAPVPPSAPAGAKPAAPVRTVMLGGNATRPLTPVAPRTPGAPGAAAAVPASGFKPSPPSAPAGSADKGSPAMPKATVPVSKPSGFSKPAGFGKPAAADDTEDLRKDHPVVLTILSIALLLCGYFVYIQFEIDQVKERTSYQTAFFGNPIEEGTASTSSDDAYDDYADDEPTEEDDAPAEEDDAPAEEEEAPEGFDEEL